MCKHTVYSDISTDHYPSIDAVVAHVKSSVQPAYKCFRLKFNNGLNPVLIAFFTPSKVNELKPSAADLDSLCALTFWTLATQIFDGLKAELLLCVAAAKDAFQQINVLEWLKSH